MDAFQRWTPPDFSDKPLENYQKAMEKGYQEGFERGVAEAKTQMAQKEAELVQLINHFSQSMATFETKLTEPLLRLAMQVVSVFLHHVQQESPEQLIQLITEALRQLDRSAFPVTVLLNPQHHAVLLAYFEKNPMIWQGVQLKPSDSILVGGCHIDCQQYFYDHSWDTHLRFILTELLTQAGINSSQAIANTKAG